MTNKPCCPSKISLMNVKIANQNTGVMSTPKAGGMLPFASLNRGSDGHATMAHGNSLRFVSGYHDATTRHSIAKDMKFRKGPSAVAVGFTQASVSARSNPLPEVIDTPTTVSEIDEATIGSIIRKADDAVVTAFVGEAGATKADAPLIVDMNTIHKNAIRRYIFVYCIGMV
mmetsp:Transcript_4164/g.10814  ORF Transcript_4164/g.10814 Transcript_4164/m.10814 type:complete len:171 (+) Transcript_4164:243-755(+)